MRRRRRFGSDDDARSRVWAISSGSDTIGLSYGPIGIVALLGSSGRVEEGSRNVCDAAAFGRLTTRYAGVSGHPMWDSEQPGRRHQVASVIRHDGGSLSLSGF